VNAVVDLEELGDSLVVFGLLLAHLLDLGLGTLQSRGELREDVAILDGVARLEGIQALLEQTRFGLDLAHVFGCLGAVVRLRASVVSSHNLHKTVGFLQVLWLASPDELLELGRLRFLLLLFHFFRRL
jgi:hypothetical protein